MGQQIIMNFSTAPSVDDINVIALEQIENLPDELVDLCEDVVIQIEDIADEATESDLDLDHPYDLLALFKGGKQLSPGIEKKSANDDDTLVLYRRALLDVWCETGEDISQIVREAIIEELATNFEFSDDDIEDMQRRYV